MKDRQISDSLYEVWVYDWVDRHEDYLCGYVKRSPDVLPEDCDTYFWMFYPTEYVNHLTCRDLLEIGELVSDLNIKLEQEGEEA